MHAMRRRDARMHHTMLCSPARPFFLSTFAMQTVVAVKRLPMLIRYLSQLAIVVRVFVRVHPGR